MEIFKKCSFGGLSYTISNSGRIFGDKGELKQRKNADGYKQVTMGVKGQRTSKLVHRLVAETFIANPFNLAEVNHKDYDRTNNCYENLEWISHVDNVLYSSQNGNYKNNTSGVKNGRSKYSEGDILAIRKLYDEGNCVMNIIKIMFPSLNYKERKNKWTRIKDICLRKTYVDL